jgi:hypothetical protein
MSLIMRVNIKCARAVVDKFATGRGCSASKMAAIDIHTLPRLQTDIIITQNNIITTTFFVFSSITITLLLLSSSSVVFRILLVKKLPFLLWFLKVLFSVSVFLLLLAHSPYLVSSSSRSHTSIEPLPVIHVACLAPVLVPHPVRGGGAGRP